MKQMNDYKKKVSKDNERKQNEVSQKDLTLDEWKAWKQDNDRMMEAKESDTNETLTQIKYEEWRLEEERKEKERLEKEKIAREKEAKKKAEEAKREQERIRIEKMEERKKNIALKRLEEQREKERVEKERVLMDKEDKETKDKIRQEKEIIRKEKYEAHKKLMAKKKEAMEIERARANQERQLMTEEDNTGKAIVRKEKERIWKIKKEEWRKQKAIEHRERMKKQHELMVKHREEKRLRKRQKVSFQLSSFAGSVPKQVVPVESKFKDQRIDAKLPLVSFIITTYNVGEYIEETILSVINQTYENIEIVVIDDCSCDNTQNIITRICKSFINKKIIFKKFNHRTSGGCCNASNLGLNTCTGQYVCFVDGDDYIDENMATILANKIDNNNLDIVICDYYEVIQKKVKNAYHDEKYKSLIKKYKKEKIYFISPCPWCKIYRKKYLDEKKIKFISGDYFYEDNPFHWFAIMNTDKILAISDKLVYHRKETEREQTTSAFHNTENYSLTSFFTVFYIIKNLIDCDSNLENIFKIWIKNQRHLKCIMNYDKKMNNKIRNILQNFIDIKSTYCKHLTIIIPVYKLKSYAFLEKFLNHCSTMSDVEVIIVNDTGEIDSILELYYSKYCNVFLINNKSNMGAGRSRNKAIHIIEGKYVFFCDSDDEINIDLFFKEVDLLRENNYDMLFFKYYINGQINNSYEQIYNNLTTSKELFLKIPAYPWQFILKSSILHNNTIHFGITNIHNDINYYLLAIYFAKNMHFSDEIIYNYKKSIGIINNIPNRINSVHSLYFVYTKLSEIDYPYFKQFKHFIVSVLKWNIDKDEANSNEILKYATAYNLISSNNALNLVVS